MKKLSLKKLNLGTNDLLQKEQLKSVFGGYDGFDCAEVFDRCDADHPDDFAAFQECMFWAACV